VTCPKCGADVLDIDVRCEACGAALGATGAHRMIGQLFLGTYELVDVLGHGGMSVVFKARHKLTEQEVALKILPPELAANQQVKSRFVEEAKALAALDHPNIVHLYNFGQEGGSFVLAMQFVQGKTWERLILEQKRLDWRVSSRIAIDVLRALEYAHGRGVIHRDMKPSNVLVRAHDASATVMDFGIAKMAQSTKLTATGQTMGTVRYMSPEQVRGKEVDLRTDIYSLGATLYESLVGDTPFDGSTHFDIMTKHLNELPKPPRAHGVELPAIIEDAVMRCLKKRVDDRFDNAREMRKVLESALRDSDLGLVETQRLGAQILGDVRASLAPATSTAGRPTTATAAELADQLEPSASRSRRTRAKWPWIAAVVALVGGGAAAMVLVRGSGTSDYESKVRIDGVALVAGEQFADPRVRVETDGAIAPKEVADAYRAVLDKLVAFEPDVRAKLDVVDEIVVVPAAALCEPSAYPVGSPPETCKIDLAETAIQGGGQHNVLVVDARPRLREALAQALGKAVCDFQPIELDPAKRDPQAIVQLKKICEMGKRFAASGPAR
jgi:serine/threonine protein kinase